MPPATNIFRNRFAVDTEGVTAAVARGAGWFMGRNLLALKFPQNTWQTSEGGAESDRFATRQSERIGEVRLSRGHFDDGLFPVGQESAPAKMTTEFISFGRQN